MEINKQLFEDVISGKLKGTFVLRNNIKINTSDVKKNVNGCINIYPYRTKDYSYTEDGHAYENSMSNYDIVDFISDTDMKENELKIEIPEGKEIDWDESKKQNKIVLKDKQLTYSGTCRKLFVGYGWFFTDAEGGIHHTVGGNTYSCANNSTTKQQLECILAKNKLANIAKYLNNGWKPNKGEHVFYLTCFGDFENKVYVGEYCLGAGENLIVFKTSKIAQQAIEILGEETVKLALEPLGI